jgi:type I restriction enzyme S subunit
MKKGWEIQNLGDLCDVVGGGTPPKDNPAFYSGQIPWATVRDMRQDLITETEFRITKDAVKSSATNVIPSGNVVIATRVGLGKVCLLGQDTAINQDLRGIIPRSNESLAIRFLYWWLKSITDVIVAEGTGATVQGVKLPFVKSLQIPLPPLPEQERIVRILDEAFEKIAIAKANAEKNLANARELFESYLNEVFAKRGEGWEEKRLGDVCSIGDGNYSSKYPRASEFIQEGIPFITATCLKNGTIISDGIRYISAEQHSQLRKGHVKVGDLVVVVRGSGTGNNSLVPQKFHVANLNSQLAYLRSNGNISSQFLFYVFNSNEVQKNVRSEISGSAQPQLPNNKLLDICIKYPSLEKQAIIVDMLKTFHDNSSYLIVNNERKIKALEELKKSLLHQAFTGQL